MKRYAAFIILLSLWLLPKASDAAGLTIDGEAVNRSTVNGSVSITNGNTFQTILPSIIGQATIRQSLTIQNNNINSDNCWIVIGGLLANATKGIAILLGPGGSYQRYFPYVPSDIIYGTCATTSDTVYVDTQ